MQTLRTSPSPFLLVNSWQDERKVDWCTFITEDGEEITIGLPSEWFVGFRNQYHCDLQLVCRLALEQLDQWPTTGPYQIEGKTYLKLERALKHFDFRKADLVESAIESSEQAIDGITRRLNRLHGDGWEYFYTERYAPRIGETEGSRFVFRHRKTHAAV